MGNWIKGAVRNKGALHRALGIPEDKPIPKSKLEEAKHSKDPHIRRMAHLAETLKGLNHGSRDRKRGGS
jgi:hypothetical protein